MVTYELVEDSKERSVYHYYPEGDKDKKPGEIMVDRITKGVKLKSLAELDFIPLFDKIYYVAKGRHDYSFYGWHVQNELIDRLNEGQRPKKVELDYGIKDFIEKLQKSGNIMHMIEEGQIVGAELEFEMGFKLKYEDGEWQVNCGCKFC